MHVAGTNGRSSVTAMVASALQANGCRTGRYVSPYLEDFRERIVLGNEMISPADLVCLVNAVKPQVEAMVSEEASIRPSLRSSPPPRSITTQKRGATTSLWK